MSRKSVLWLVRHGETIENKANICQGQTDGTLSEEGIRQAEELGKALKGYCFDLIYSSDLKRAMDTVAKIVSEQISPVAVKQDARLRERSFGSFQGKVFPEDRKNFIYPADVESIDQMGERLGDFLKDLFERETGEQILIVTHGVALRVLLSLLLSGSTDQTDLLPILKNASVTRVIIENGKVTELNLEPLKEQ